tara:strand:+ start:1535 stop:2152 length:618 start_codon:yes stop_codon:yes gene_type:complete
MNAEDPSRFYHNLSFALAFSSLMLTPNDVSSFREEGDEFHLITKGNRKMILQPDEVVYFDKNDSEDLMVYDFFDIREMTGNNKSRIEDYDSSFVNEINFYKSKRSGFNGKDLVLSSRLNTGQLLDADYGQGIAMIKAIRMLKNAGLNGKFAHQRGDKRYYKRIKLDFFKREVSPIMENDLTFKQVYEMKQEEGVPWKTIEKLRHR